MLSRMDVLLIVLVLFMGTFVSIAVARHMDVTNAKDVTRLINEKIVNGCNYEII